MTGAVQPTPYTNSLVFTKNAHLPEWVLKKAKQHDAKPSSRTAKIPKIVTPVPMSHQKEQEVLEGKKIGTAHPGTGVNYTITERMKREKESHSLAAK